MEATTGTMTAAMTTTDPLEVTEAEAAAAEEEAVELPPMMTWTAFNPS